MIIKKNCKFVWSVLNRAHIFSKSPHISSHSYNLFRTRFKFKRVTFPKRKNPSFYRSYVRFRVIWHKLPEKEITAPERDISADTTGPLLSNLSSTQLQVLKKLALLKLTAHMEKYCPSHRTGWNWDLPKFIRKIKTPVYKGLWK